MKKLLYILLFFTSFANAQIVNIPDANFKAKLLEANATNFIAVNASSQSIKIDVNNDGNIQLSEALEVEGLNVNSSNISNLTGIESFSNLYNFNCSSNQVGSLDLTSNSNLLTLWCNNNQLTNLIIPQSLHSLYCYNNLLTSLDMSANSQMISIRCYNNQLTSLNVSGLPISELYCYNNNLSSLDLSNCSNLSTLSVENNQLTSLDMSSSLQQATISATNNPIETVFLKNGRTEMLFITPTVLEFMCVDDENISFYEQAYPGLIISSYCSFTPGGNYNTITGSITFDSNINGCDINDALQPNIKININNGTNQGATFTNNSGNYNFYTQTGSFNLTPNVENPTFFNFSPTSATIPFADNNNNTTTQDFCISANGVHPDVEIVIASITPARPGFDAVYQIVYKNKGNQTLSGNITFTYDDAVLDFVSATQLPDTQSTGLLNWNYTNLLPFENRSFYVTLNVNSPTETPAVNIGNILNFEATITPVVGDENAEDNLFSYNQTVVGSYDPNNIECLEGNVVPPSEIGNYLHYIINFENTGTFEAENVVVKTTIDETKFDVNSLQMLNTSHNAYIKQTGNVVEFIFENIALDTGGHGNVLLKIKSKDDLVTGNSVSKRADIFFDYNAPIDTGLVNTIFQSLSTPDYPDNSIGIYPNPTKSNVNINCNSKIQSVQLYDVQGRLLQTQIIDEVQTSINISEKSNGIYFLKVTSDKGTKVEKLVKK